MSLVAPTIGGGEWVMDRNTQRVEVEEADRDGPVRAAENVLREFEELLAILERQVSNATASNTSDRAGYREAKLAAARGVELSTHLVELLRTAR
jgi:hypothetical protein